MSSKPVQLCDDRRTHCCHLPSRLARVSGLFRQICDLSMTISSSIVFFTLHEVRILFGSSMFPFKDCGDWSLFVVAISPCLQLQSVPVCSYDQSLFVVTMKSMLVVTIKSLFVLTIKYLFVLTIKSMLQSQSSPCLQLESSKNTATNNKEDFQSCHLPHKVGAQGALQ